MYFEVPPNKTALGWREWSLLDLPPLGDTRDRLGRQLGLGRLRRLPVELGCPSRLYPQLDGDKIDQEAPTPPQRGQCQPRDTRLRTWGTPHSAGFMGWGEQGWAVPGTASTWR